MPNYIEVKYDWLKISVLGGVLLSLFILILVVWDINPLSIFSNLVKSNSTQGQSPENISVSPTQTPSVTITLASPTPASSQNPSRDIFNPAKGGDASRNLALPSPTPIITFPFSPICPTNAIINDSRGNPQGCLVKPKF